MESPHFIIEEIGKIKLISESVLARILNYRSEVSVLTFEITKLNSIIDELRDEKANMQTGFYQMVERGGFDLSPCVDCGESVVCIPEGLALCRTCATKGGEV